MDKRLDTLIRESGLVASEEYSVEKITIGGNNRSYRLIAGNNRYYIKEYFQSKHDQRDRLGHEVAFLHYANRQNISHVPQALYVDQCQGMVIYNYIEGRPFDISMLSNSHILAAADFIAALNEGNSPTSDIPIASEGAFSVDDHIVIVEQRIDRLKGMDVETEVDMEAKEFLNRELLAVWDNVKETLHREMAGTEFDLITEQDRCISPSDFGFHNALMSDNGEVYFVDFEYAGWDDPAKMAADFFIQPRVRVPFVYFDEFTDIAFSNMGRVAWHKARTMILFPLFQVKWCCILLNEFLKDSAQRRGFASISPLDVNAVKRTQLNKSRNLLSEITAGR